MAGPKSGSEAVMAAAGEMPMMAFAQIQTRMMREALAFQAELLDFARRRIGRDIEANERLAKCQSVPEAFEVMSGFCQQAIDNYAEEARTLMEMGRRAAGDAAGDAAGKSNGGN